jgi:hypothetical protein
VVEFNWDFVLGRKLQLILWERGTERRGKLVKGLQMGAVKVRINLFIWWGLSKHAKTQAVLGPCERKSVERSSGAHQ